MTLKQLTVFVGNRRGALADVTGLLAEKGVDLRALSIADTRDFGILRLIVSDTEKARKVLAENGYLVESTEVVGVKIGDEPGKLALALQTLSAAGVDVEYLYAFLARTARHAYVVLRVPDNKAAEAVLTAAGYHLILEEDLKKL